MNERTVWVIERGQYSDYRVVGVYSTRENAEAIAAKINAGDEYDNATVAEWSLDPGIEAMNKGYVPFRIVMLADGSTEQMERTDVDAYNVAEGTDLRLWERTKAPAYRGKGIPDALTGTVWAKDAKHALKIASERRVQMIASGEWKP